jgi:hypothetical protein
VAGCSSRASAVQYGFIFKWALLNSRTSSTHAFGMDILPSISYPAHGIENLTLERDRSAVKLRVVPGTVL